VPTFAIAIEIALPLVDTLPVGLTTAQPGDDPAGPCGP